MKFGDVLSNYCKLLQNVVSFSRRVGVSFPFLFITCQKLEEITFVVNNTGRLSVKISSYDSIMTNLLSSFLDG